MTEEYPVAKHMMIPTRMSQVLAGKVGKHSERFAESTDGNRQSFGPNWHEMLFLKSDHQESHPTPQWRWLIPMHPHPNRSP
jgi:hypothetical protein